MLCNELLNATLCQEINPLKNFAECSALSTAMSHMHRLCQARAHRSVHHEELWLMPCMEPRSGSVRRGKPSFHGHHSVAVLTNYEAVGDAFVTFSRHQPQWVPLDNRFTALVTNAGNEFAESACFSQYSPKRSFV